MIILIILLLLVLLVVSNNRQENFINLDNNSDIKVVKPGDPEFNYFEYEFDFSDFTARSILNETIYE